MSYDILSFPQYPRIKEAPGMFTALMIVLVVLFVMINDIVLSHAAAGNFRTWIRSLSMLGLLKVACRMVLFPVELVLFVFAGDLLDRLLLATRLRKPITAC